MQLIGLSETLEIKPELFANCTVKKQNKIHTVKKRAASEGQRPEESASGYNAVAIVEMTPYVTIIILQKKIHIQF